MNISFEIPQDIEQQLRSEGIDPNRHAKECVLVNFFRRGFITHAQLAKALDLDRFETDALLQRHRVTERSLGHEDVDADVQSIEDAIGDT